MSQVMTENEDFLTIYEHHNNLFKSDVEYCTRFARDLYTTKSS